MRTTTSNRTRVYLPHYSERLGWSIALGFIAFLGAAHILIRTSTYGIGDFHGEAGAYIYDAQALANGKIFESESLALLRQPPVFATVLSIYRLLGVEVSEIAKYVNVVSFGLIVLVTGTLLHRFVRFPLVVIGAAMTIMISYPLVRISSQLLSETFFILVTLLALLRLGIFLEQPGKRSGFWVLIVFSALAVLTRWMGITVIFTGMLLILTRRGPPSRTKWKQSTIYSVASLLPVALWITRNWIVNSNLPHSATPCLSDQSFGTSLTRLGDNLHLWLFVQNDLGWLDICLWTAAALAGFEVTKALTTRSMSSSEERVATFQKIGTSLDTKERPVLPFTAFAIVYIVVLFLVAPYTSCSPPDEPRYLLPIYVPIVITAAVWLERFLLKTYQTSGILVRKSPDNWSIDYHKSFGPIAIIRWIIMGLVLIIYASHIVRNLNVYVDVLITYDPYGYQF